MGVFKAGEARVFSIALLACEFRWRAIVCLLRTPTDVHGQKNVSVRSFPLAIEEAMN
jgi:hypothetical protein